MEGGLRRTRSSLLRRDNGLSVVDLEGLASETVMSRLDSLGTGSYQLLVLLGVGLATLSESIEMGSVAPMHTALSRSFHFDTATRSELPLVTFAGSGLGLAFAGPFCDRFGRKGALILSLAMIVVAMIATAMLPSDASRHYILLLRFFAGFAGAVQMPAGITLAVESCAVDTRAQLTFRITFLSSLGYLVESFGIQMFMPHFGEADTDRWRVFCLFTAASALLAMPLVCMLYESPCFLAVSGQAERCVDVLDGIARWNGKAPFDSSTRPARSPGQEAKDSQKEIQSSDNAKFSDWIAAMSAAAWRYGWLIALLCVIDSCRTFYVSGSSYLWKDLVNLVSGESIATPAQINVIASFTPLIGLVIGERFVRYGVRRVTFWASILAAVSLMALSQTAVRISPWGLLVFMMTAKLTYGTLGTCVALMKVESFPTEIRVSAFAVISVVAKVLCALAPTLVEFLKGTEAASSWEQDRLTFYMFLLLSSVLISGCLALFVPGTTGDSAPLKDYMECKSIKDTCKAGSSTQYGAISLRNRDGELHVRQQSVDSSNSSSSDRSTALFRNNGRGI